MICAQGFLPNQSCVLSIYCGECLCTLSFSSVSSVFVSSCAETPILVCHFILVWFRDCFLFTWRNLWALHWGWKGWFPAVRLSSGSVQLSTGTSECCLYLEHDQSGKEVLWDWSPPIKSLTLCKSKFLLKLLRTAQVFTGVMRTSLKVKPEIWNIPEKLIFSDWGLFSSPVLKHLYKILVGPQCETAQFSTITCSRSCSRME